jgi:hypothetical protein
LDGPLTWSARSKPSASAISTKRPERPPGNRPVTHPHQHPADTSIGRKLLYQRALSDTGFTADQHQPTLPLGGVRQERAKGHQQVVALKQHLLMRYRE